jgi:hypothetical protein
VRLKAGRLKPGQVAAHRTTACPLFAKRYPGSFFFRRDDSLVDIRQEHSTHPLAGEEEQEQDRGQKEEFAARNGNTVARSTIRFYS